MVESESYPKLRTGWFSGDQRMRTGLVFVGTYTRYGKSEGIYVFECDRKSGKLFQIALIQEQDPSWLAFSPDRRFLFAVSESKEYNGSKQGSVS